MLPVRCCSLAFVALAAVLTASRARAEEATAPATAASVGVAEPGATDALLFPSNVAAGRLLRRDDLGVDLVLGVSERQLSSLSPVGSEVDARIALARREGPFTIVGEGMLRRGIGTRDDVDAVGSLRTTLAIGHALAAGGEARVRGEVVEGVVAADDTGRPVEVIAGATAAVTVYGAKLQALAGFCWPRGPLPAGQVVLAGATFVF